MAGACRLSLSLSPNPPLDAARSPHLGAASRRCPGRSQQPPPPARVAKRLRRLAKDPVARAAVVARQRLGAVDGLQQRGAVHVPAGRQRLHRRLEPAARGGVVDKDEPLEHRREEADARRRHEPRDCEQQLLRQLRAVRDQQGGDPVEGCRREVAARARLPQYEEHLEEADDGAVRLAVLDAQRRTAALEGGEEQLRLGEQGGVQPENGGAELEKVVHHVGVVGDGSRCGGEQAEDDGAHARERLAERRQQLGRVVVAAQADVGDVEEARVRLPLEPAGHLRQQSRDERPEVAAERALRRVARRVLVAAAELLHHARVAAVPLKDRLQHAPQLLQQVDGRVQRVLQRGHARDLVGGRPRPRRHLAQQRAELLEQHRHLARAAAALERRLQPLQQRARDGLHGGQDLWQRQLRHDEGERGDEVDTVRGLEREGERPEVHLDELRHRRLLGEVLGARVAEVLHCLRRGRGVPLLLQARRDVGEHLREHLCVAREPVGVRTHGADGGVWEVPRRGQRGQQLEKLVHDWRREEGGLVRRDHLPRAKDARLDRTPLSGRVGAKGRQPLLQRAVHLLDARRRREHLARVGEHVADSVPEAAEVVGLVGGPAV
mmetsp:Transcript_24913/g.74028  ORF Transcript_24913/g.74028 Transcript_24913/m.74028 type:complete len:606 (+) Transcript_24913:34-1851(+)